MARITSVVVKQLLDYFDHEVVFPAEWSYLLLYGPNGVGKTKLLELLHCLYKCNFEGVVAIPFQWLEVQHEDGSRIEVARTYDAKADEFHLDFTLHDSGSLIPLTDRYADRGGSRLREQLLTDSSWRPYSGDLWRDSVDGEIVEWDELADRFRSIADRPRRERRPRIDRTAPIPQFLAAVPIHFIATQRLLYEHPVRRRSTARRDGLQQPTIAAYSEDLKDRLSRALGENSKRTQQLDRSFPKRVLDMAPQDIDPVEIRDRYEEQSKKRDELSDIGLIGSEIDLPLPDRDLDASELKVLKTYLDDTDQKLETFDDISARVSLLREIANARFLHKKITINTDDGIVIKRLSDDMSIPPRSLSSGEQHELVLLYDLLFNVPRNALVLIDEPEISLHIAWQKSFIDDIARIAELAALRFIIATHSPQIINKSWDRTCELGPHMADD